MISKRRRSVQSALQRQQRKFNCEALEPRIVLAGDLCITEFMASNSSTIDDSFGESSDWIELYNGSASAIDLSQYHLTDDATELDKFPLPAVDLLPGESVLVFASSRDLVTATGEIHANFSLSASGDYLGLTDVNANVVQDFGASYPAQLEDISYGVAMFSAVTPTPIVFPAANANILIPDAVSGPALGTTWTDTNFNDASWTSATLPIGYENGSGYQNIINTTVPAGTTSTYLRFPFNLASLDATNDLTLNVRYDDGFVVYINGQFVIDDRAPENPDWASTATSNHSDGAAVQFQTFDVSSGKQYLQTGQNILAIQALNFNASSSDYLFEATLEGSGAGIVTPIEEGFFDAATPGSGNGETFDGFVEEVLFSLDHGFYDQAQTLLMTTPTSGATIVYTTDGSDPTVDANLNPTNGTAYTAPLSISQTTVVRAAAFLADSSPSLSRARTYLFTGDVITQGAQAPGPGWPAPGNNSTNGVEINYGVDPVIINEFGQPAVEDALKSISTISLVTDVDNLFDSATGIYVNAQNRGKGWERFSSVELIEPDGSPGFQANTGIRIRGGFSRNDGFPKRSLRFFFRGEYGDSKLNYDLFNGEGASEFDVFDLRTAQNYAWNNGADDRNTFLREVFGRDAQADLEHPYTRSRYHHLYLNGVYWGLYQTQERVEAFYGETYLGGDADDYDRVKANNQQGRVTEVADGDDVDWRQLFNLTQAVGVNPVANADNYWTAQGLNPDGTRNLNLPVLLDVDNLIEYELILFLTGGYDSGISAFGGNERPNNWVAIRNRETDDHGFQFFIHDNEHSMGTGSQSNDRTGPFDGPYVNTFEWSNPSFIHQDLMNHPEYQLRFQDRVREHFYNGGVFTTQNNIDRVEEREAVVATAILAESARWGDTTGDPAKTPDDWQGAANFVKNWLSSRNSVVLVQLINDGLHSQIAPVAFSQHGGAVDSGFNLGMTPTGGSSQIFYTTDGTDPRLPGGGLGPATQLFSGNTTITGNTTINARVRLASGAWSALTTASFRLTAVPADASNLRVTELNFNPVAPTAAELAAVPSATRNSFEFIEFHNPTGGNVDLTGVQITTPISYTLPAISIAAGERVVLARDQLAFATRFAGLPAIGEYGDALGFGDGGDTITVVAANGSTIQSFTYGDSGNWPSLADGGGHTLEVVDINGDYNDPLNWRPSRTDFGSPTFAGEPGVSVSGLRITEVNYNPSATGAEFVEIVNESNSPINLNGVRFVEGVEFDFSASAISTLQPGDAILVVDDLVDFTAKYGAGLPVAGEFASGSLSNGGERVILFDTNGNVIHDFVYDDVAPWDTSADGLGSSLEIVSSNGDYSSATNWQASSVLGGTPGNLILGLACDYVGGGNGCNTADIDALYAGTNGAPGPLTDALISQWLADASDVSNPAKGGAGHQYVLGDIDLDGKVDSTDLGLLLNNFPNAQGLGWGGGNLNSDAAVDSTDLGLLLNNFSFDSTAVAATVASVAAPAAEQSTAAEGTLSGSSPSDSNGVMVDGDALSESSTDAFNVSLALPAQPVVAADSGFSLRDLVFGEFGEDGQEDSSSEFLG